MRIHAGWRRGSASHFLLAVLDLLEFRRFRQREPDPQADDHQHDAEQERQPPAPGEELRVGHRGRRRSRTPACRARGRAARRAAASCRRSPAVLRRVLDRHQHGAAPLAAEAEALDQAAGDQQDRRPDAERLVGRQQADHRRRHAHDEQGEIEHGLAADRVAVVAEHEAAERPGDEAERIGGERQQRADHRIERREEQLVEDQRGGGAVEKEVVPLDRGADQARGRDLHVRGVRGLVQRDGGHGLPPCAFASVMRGLRSASRVHHPLATLARRSARNARGFVAPWMRASSMAGRARRYLDEQFHEANHIESHPRACEPAFYSDISLVQRWSAYDSNHGSARLGDQNARRIVPPHAHRTPPALTTGPVRLSKRLRSSASVVSSVTNSR